MKALSHANGNKFIHFVLYCIIAKASSAFTIYLHNLNVSIIFLISTKHIRTHLNTSTSLSIFQ
ncbi:hypothetical protein CW304_01140 [Bacillus sp. UFRGS-B20]|nr:hypothetical protein CW304_01140 [Bacillus sp. UFRGS-B20]